MAISRRSWFRTIAVALILGAALNIVGRALVIHSIPYCIAREFIREDAEIEQEIGSVESVDLAIIDGVFYSSFGNQSDLELSLDVCGIAKCGVVTIRLEKREDHWQVDHAGLEVAGQGRRELEVGIVASSANRETCARAESEGE